MNRWSRKSNTQRHLARMAAFAVLLGASLPSTAAVFCVGDGETLSEVLETAPINASNNGESNAVRLRAGRFTSDANAFGEATWAYDAYYEHALSISGGWNSDCTQQTIDPTLTVLDGRRIRPVLDIGASGLSIHEGISVSNLTLANGRASVPDSLTLTSTSALRFNLIMAPGAVAAFENLVITGNIGTASANGASVVELNSNSSGTLRVRNNVVYANDMTGAPGSSIVNVFTSGSAVGVLTNNSVFGNAASSDVVGVMGRGVLSLTNNVLAENDSTSPSFVQFEYFTPPNVTSGLSLVNNHITSQNLGLAPPALQTGTTTGPAQWSGSGPFRTPDLGSPLRDSGSNSVFGGVGTVDARGSTRIVNMTVDRGAVEAQPPANTGPTVLALQPAAGSTTVLPATAEPTQTTRVFFLTQSGTGSGRTTVDCRVAQGNGAVVLRGLQTIPNGGMALPVDVAFDNPVAGAGDVQGTLACDVSRENAETYTLSYNFVVRSGTLFGNGFE
jgi:hypothetical protein